MKKSPYILVIDDDEITNFITEKLIKRWNSEVEMFFITGIEESKSYLSDITNRRPDIVLLDINLIGGTGWDILEFYSQLKEKLEVSVVMVSSSVYQEDKKKAFTYKPVIGYQEKPINPEFLESFLRV